MHLSLPAHAFTKHRQRRCEAKLAAEEANCKRQEEARATKEAERAQIRTICIICVYLLELFCTQGSQLKCAHCTNTKHRQRRREEKLAAEEANRKRQEEARATREAERART